MFMSKTVKSLFPLFTLLLIASAFQLHQPLDAIVLQNEPLPFKPTGYYIAEIKDNRPQKTAIAQILVKGAANKPNVQTVDLQGGAPTAIRKFVRSNLPKDERLLPVVIDISQMKLIETALPNNRVDGQIKFNLNFGIQKEYGTEALVTYQGGMHYIRSADNLNDIEPQLRKTLVNGLTFFNNWMKINTPAHIKLVKNVKINITNYTEKQEGDTIYYAANRPLTWDDFRSTYKQQGNYAAQVMPSMGYDQQNKVENGTVYVSLSMKTFLPKSTCWVNSYYKDDYTLNHEQRHFDIVKIVAEQYKKKILSEHLTPDTYEAFISMEFLEAYRNMNKMQKAYDDETRHGRDHDAQYRWNERIDKDLQMFGVAKRDLP
jgi:hypothetical protein